ncbi:MAG: hypothetical protein ACTSYL_07835 [Candidatus Thorarchaeota archaeon]
MREERLNDPISCGHRSQEVYSYIKMGFRETMSTSTVATIFWMNNEHAMTLYGSGWLTGAKGIIVVHKEVNT